MAEGVGDAGGIRSLLTLLDEHQEAIDYQCLTLGLDLNELGTVRFDWRRFAAVVRWSEPTSPIGRSVHGDRAEWSATEHLLAATVDALNAANWQRGGGKGKKPKPVPRPGAKPSEESRRFGTGKMSVDEARKFFNRVNRPAESVVVPAPTVACSESGCGRSVKARGLCPKHYQRWWRANRI